MLLIHHFNLTHFQNDTRYYPLLQTYLLAEFALYIGDIFQILFFIWVVLSARQFHVNFTIILVYLYGIHVVDDMAILVMRIQMFNSIDDHQLTSNPNFLYLMNISVFAMLTAMCIMPFLILERCFATIFLSNYETKPRKYISLILLLILGIFGYFACVHVQESANIVPIVVLIMSLNTVALGVNMYLKYYNRKQHQNFHIGNSQYSLAKRFQISENIRTLHMLNLIIFYMGCMNFLVVISVMISGFRGLSPEQQAVCSIVLNVSVFVYSYSLSHIIACCCDKWKRHLETTMRKVGCSKNVVQVVPLRDTFGTEMTVKVSADSHFRTLRSTWNVSAKATMENNPDYAMEDYQI